eukprot:gene19110-biopygen25120
MYLVFRSFAARTAAAPEVSGDAAGDAPGAPDPPATLRGRGGAGVRGGATAARAESPVELSRAGSQSSDGAPGGAEGEEEPVALIRRPEGATGSIAAVRSELRGVLGLPSLLGDGQARQSAPPGEAMRELHQEFDVDLSEVGKSVKISKVYTRRQLEVLEMYAIRTLDAARAGEVLPCSYDNSAECRTKYAAGSGYTYA